ncbi:hypothetical protein AM501_15045 [Aneurinibacillus migulanus]|uniref:hypothetical protein n=1 Tax=Aneurinibacillus migulanus TaxID=47500 RepID=UPI0005BBCE58|nr:hypothetical protein [Aneurinibacillus migulanus]KIV59516.1 hypothetical protein TS64_02235 [Aneurinibacillus migulanus]KPD07553.1 hypothetical protein AM501_15045 [Aneurinibacillus migulanus]
MEYILEDGVVYSIERIGNNVIKAIAPHMMYDEESGEFVPAPPPEPVPKVPSEIDILGKQLAEKELQILQLQADTELFGKQIADKDIQIMSLQSENEVIGQQLVEKDLRLMQVETDNEKMGQSIVNLELKLVNMEGK